MNTGVARDSGGAGLGLAPYLALFCLVFWIVAGVGGALFADHDYIDYVEYLGIVTGRPAVAHLPFAGRLLGPLLAKGLVAGAGLSPTAALILVCAAGWALVPLLAGPLLYRRGAPIQWAMVLASAPFAALGARYIMTPDGWSVSMVLGVLLGAELGLASVAAPFAALLALTRDTSILAVSVQLAARSKRSRALFTVLVLAAFVVGLVIKGHLQAAGATNIHRMSGLFYLLAKVPVNALSNLAGLHIYVNTVAYCAKPAFAFPIGHIAMLGDVNVLGLCPPRPSRILQSLACYALVFGALPLLILRRMAREPVRQWLKSEGGREMAGFLLLCFLSPCLGLTVARLFVEAYPLLFTATAALSKDRSLSWKRAGALVAYNLVAVGLLSFLR